MPTYTIVDPQSGRKMRVSGDSPPSEQDIAELFASAPSAPVRTAKAGVRGGAPMVSDQSRGRQIPQAKPKSEWSNPGAKLVAGYLTNQVADRVNALDSAQHRLFDLPVGVAQLATNAAALLPIDAVKDGADRLNRFVANREQDYQARNPDNLATYGGAAIGTGLPWFTGTGVNIMNRLAGTGRIVPQGTGVLRVPSRALQIGVGGAAQGVAAGAVTPDTSGDFSDKGDQVMLSAGISAGAPLAALAGAKAIDGGAYALDYALRPEKIASRKLAEWYGKEPEVIQKLRDAVQYFRGEQVTAAQALQNPQAFAVEKALNNNPQFKVMSEEVRNANNAGRLGVVDDIAKTPADREAAIAARKAATDPFYNETVNNTMVDVADVEKRLRELTLDPNSTVRGFANEQMALIKKLKDEYGGQIPLANLQGIQRQLFSEFDSMAAKNGYNKSGRYVLANLSEEFNNILERAAPGYRENARTYARLSQPINDMDAGQAILTRADGRTPNTAGEAPLSLADINRAIADDGKSKFGVSDSTLGRLMGLRESLKREGQGIRTSGSDTAYNLNADGWLARLIYGDSKGRQAATYMTLPAAGAYVGEALGGGFGLGVGSTAGTGLSIALNNRITDINSRIATEAARGVYDSRVAADMIEQTLKENPNQARALLERFPFWRRLLSQQP